MNISHKLTASCPLEINGENVTCIDVSKPYVFNLYDLKLSDVLQMDTQAMVKLLPRITTPALCSAAIAQQVWWLRRRPCLRATPHLCSCGTPPACSVRLSRPRRDEPYALPIDR